MKRRKNGKTGRPAWAGWSEDRLLGVPLRALGVTVEAPGIAGAVRELGEELGAKGVAWRPHVWVSNEWFSADGISGFAVPFYLGHPRLKRLEKTQMFEVEGGTHDWCMRLMRHECGHAIDNAFRLHRKRRYRELFGNFSDPYPDSYRPKPYTKRFVIHLDMWYAQAHPAEDFAETFAVWLNPRSHWRTTYEGWPAKEKLEWVDEVMREIGPAERGPVHNARTKRELSTLRMTLREHYDRKRSYYYRDHPQFYDRDLRRIFSDGAEFAGNPAAAEVIRRLRGDVRLLVSRWTGESQLTIDPALADMILRVRQLKLRQRKGLDETRTDLAMMLAVQTMNWLNGGKHRVVV